MDIRKVGATRGAHWLNASIHLIEKNPRALLSAGLVLACIAAAPGLLGPLGMPLLLALVVLYPVMMGGLVGLVAKVDAGGSGGPADLFTAFRTGRAPALMLMCLPQVAFGLVMVMAVLGWLGMDNIERMAQQEEPDLSAINPGMTAWVVLAFMLGIIGVIGATLFAIPLAMLAKVPGFTAIGISLRAALLRNFGALLVYLLCLLLAMVIALVALALLAMLLNAVLGLLGPVVAAAGQLLVSILFNAGLVVVLACGHHLATLDVFGAGRGSGAGGGEGDGGGDGRPPEREVAAEL